MISPGNSYGHFYRLRKRFLNGGLEGFLDYEVIEMLLSVSSRKDQKTTAKRLLKHFKTLRGVLEASPGRLQEVEGIGPVNLFGLKLVQAVARRYLKDRILGSDYISSSDKVLEYLIHNLRDRNRELFQVLLLNARNQVIDLVTVFEGSLTSSMVYPREVIRLILTRDAAAVIFIHNHPSGNPKPSSEDRHLTTRLKQACSAVDVSVHDHLIIAGNSYTSFADQGLL